jgi:NOL1/NOP2/fmu family ribosome biogenesis protein
MKNLEILNRKAIKEILKKIKEQWDAEVDFGDKVFLEGKDNDIFIVNKDISRVDLTKIRINSLGLYIGQQMVDGLRLSIEGSQLIGPKAKKNVLEVDEKQARKWLKGYELNVNENFSGYLIIKNKDDFFGCGKVKDNKVLNYVPKNRRLKVSD